MDSKKRCKRFWDKSGVSMGSDPMGMKGKASYYESRAK